MNAPAIELRAVTCVRETAMVREVSAVFCGGIFTLLSGTDTAARNLLLRIAGLRELPDSGEVLLAGKSTLAWSEEVRAEMRSQQLGFVFRAPFLLPAFSVVENVAMPLFRRSQADATEAGARTGELLAFVGLLDAAEEQVEQLSLASRHRVSLARALVNRPAALLVEDLDAELGEEDLRAFGILLRDAAVRFDVAVIASASSAWPLAENMRALNLQPALAVPP